MSLAPKILGSILALALFLFLFIEPASAQNGIDPASREIMVRIFESEPSLTEDDMTIAIELLPRANNNNLSEKDLYQYAEDKGYTPDRLAYIMAKVSGGMLILVNKDYETVIINKYGTPAAVPTQEEMELISKYFNDLMAIL
ncbi:MAG: hypothetical protein LBE38_08285 [Deltaproteobacteria bacterium]|jgi:hypothetical protein|nr:hypothetical protein [Deltaproteobacteria bacterium]